MDFLHELSLKKSFQRNPSVVSDELGTQNPGFGFWKSHGEIGLSQLGFSSFLPNVWQIFIIVEHAERRYFEKSSNMPKKIIKK